MFWKGAARRQAGGPLISAVAELSHAGSLFGTRRDFILARPDVGTKAWRKLRRRFTPVQMREMQFLPSGIYADCIFSRQTEAFIDIPG